MVYIKEGKTMKVVIPYLNSGTNELDWSLKSLKHIDHDEVYIVGDYPLTMGGV